MISGEKIGQYIADPSTIHPTDLDELKGLTEKFPYCSSLHILHLKAMALADHIDFESELKLTAAHLNDREHLYRLIHFGTSPEETDVTEEVSAIEQETELPVEETAQKEEVVPEEESDAPEEIIAEEKEEHYTEPDTELTEEVVEEIPDEKEIIHSEQTETTDDLLETEIINAAIDVAYVPTGVTEEDTEEAVDAIDEELDEIETVQEEPSETTAEVDPEPEMNENISFIEWLRIKQQRAASPAQENKEPVEEIDNPIEEEVKAEEKLTPAEEEEVVETASKKTSKQKIDALLDKFIREEPTISRPVKDFYNPAKTAKKSIQESDDLVSETLAKIHVMQKNYSKAISAYEQLILLYPEKKAFFASQIEKIKQEINTK